MAVNRKPAHETRTLMMIKNKWW